MEKIHRRLDNVHGRLLTLIEPLDKEKFALRPAPNIWSVAEVVHHLCLVEQHMIQSIEQELTQPPKRLPLLNHLIPYSLLVGRRVRRVRAPKAVEPLNPPPKETVIENYNRVRATIKALSREHGRKRLSQVVMKHPFLGAFSGVKAIAFVGYHEQRHYKQIQEIISQL
ncbi:MAG TPA: DinB family protein [Pyrinomonadaceae bacterium]|jgi:hypothetical protein